MNGRQREIERLGERESFYLLVEANSQLDSNPLVAHELVSSGGGALSWELPAS